MLIIGIKDEAFAYAMNRMAYYLTDDPREKTLGDTVYESVEQLVSEGV